MSWDSRWMDMARLVASWSKDRSRKCGAVIVDSRNVLVSLGWNGFPRGVDDTVDARHERPAKYHWTEHAERNAIYNAAANGHPTKGCTIYLPWYPCADCARAIIQSGIVCAVCIEPDWSDPVWAAGFAVTREMFEQCGVHQHFIAGDAPVIDAGGN
jgi:dCMP deaminase